MKKITELAVLPLALAARTARLGQRRGKWFPP